MTERSERMSEEASYYEYLYFARSLLGLYFELLFSFFPKFVLSWLSSHVIGFKCFFISHSKDMLLIL